VPAKRGTSAIAPVRRGRRGHPCESSRYRDHRVDARTRKETGFADLNAVVSSECPEDVRVLRQLLLGERSHHAPRIRQRDGEAHSVADRQLTSQPIGTRRSRSASRTSWAGEERAVNSPLIAFIVLGHQVRMERIDTAGRSRSTKARELPLRGTRTD
jgi:hypothetical protein